MRRVQRKRLRVNDRNPRFHVFAQVQSSSVPLVLFNRRSEPWDAFLCCSPSTIIGGGHSYR